MKSEHELSESAQRAFEQYPHLESSAAFNRAVLESLATARSQRSQTLIGRLEEFLGLGLWQFASSGVLGALFPAVVLSGMMLSGHSPHLPSPSFPASTSWPGLSPFGESLRREQEWA